MRKKQRALPSIATALRIWQHSRLVPLKELSEDLQDRILILRNHPQVYAMSHRQNLISYAAHQDYLRELQRRQPKFDTCVLYCNAIRQLGSLSAEKDAKVEDADSSLRVLRPIIGVVSVDLRLDGHPLLGLYKNLYHYPHIKLGRALLFAAMLRASKLGLCEVFLECYRENIAMQKLAREVGFLAQDSQNLGIQQLRTGLLLGYQRYLPSTKKLLQDPMFSDFGELQRESASLGRS